MKPQADQMDLGDAGTQIGSANYKKIKTPSTRSLAKCYFKVQIQNKSIVLKVFFDFITRLFYREQTTIGDAVSDFNKVPFFILILFLILVMGTL